MQLAVVMTTVGLKPDAERLARLVVEEKLAACAQIVAIESVFRWDGIQQEPEWRLEMKTLEAKAPALMARLAGEHPYDEPELIVMPVLRASAGYARWVASETA